MPDSYILLYNNQFDTRSFRNTYRIAGQCVIAHIQLSEIEGFFRSCIQIPGRVLPHSADDVIRTTYSETLYDAPAWIGNAMRHSTVTQHNDEINVRIAGIGAFRVSADRSHIQILSRDPTASDSLLTEGVLGLPFVFTLAARNIWILHGSAAEYQGRLAIFLGESGYGKSTLARFLNGRPGWRRVADDVLPVTMTEEGVEALPHFPQLKLPPHEQPPLHVPERMPVAAIYAIAPPDPMTEDVEIRILSPAQAITSVIPQGVSARAFDKALLARHFDFCHGLAAALPVRQLVYPRDRTLLPALGDLLAQDLLLSARQTTSP